MDMCSEIKTSQTMDMCSEIKTSQTMDMCSEIRKNITGKGYLLRVKKKHHRQMICAQS
jgi:hypothetical protein